MRVRHTAFVPAPREIGRRTGFSKLKAPRIHTSRGLRHLYRRLPLNIESPRCEASRHGRAADELQDASGGAALCRMTASGSPESRVKRAEGQWAALQALSRMRNASDGFPLASAQELIDQWQCDLDRWSEHPGSSWIPYCEGRIHGIREFIQMTGNPTTA